MEENRTENVEQNVPKVVKKTPKKPKKMFTTCRLNVREKPTKESCVLRVLEKNEEVEVLSDKDEWVRIFDGYCMKEFLK